MVRLPVDVLLSVPMFLRAYLLARFMVLHSRQFQVSINSGYHATESTVGCGHAEYCRAQSHIDGLSIRDQDDDGRASVESAGGVHVVLLDVHVVDVHAV